MIEHSANFAVNLLQLSPASGGSATPDLDLLSSSHAIKIINDKTIKVNTVFFIFLVYKLCDYLLTSMDKKFYTSYRLNRKSIKDED